MNQDQSNQSLSTPTTQNQLPLCEADLIELLWLDREVGPENQTQTPIFDIGEQSAVRDVEFREDSATNFLSEEEEIALLNCPIDPDFYHEVFYPAQPSTVVDPLAVTDVDINSWRPEEVFEFGGRNNLAVGGGGPEQPAFDPTPPSPGASGDFVRRSTEPTMEDGRAEGKEAAESEREIRRDKMNEKLKALQEIVPNSSSEDDKVSTLDKTINHLGSLQQILQELRIMEQISWSMRPVMILSPQHYMTPMALRMNQPMLPFPAHLTPRFPTPNFPLPFVLLPNPNLLYQHYFGFRPLQIVPHPQNQLMLPPTTSQPRSSTGYDNH